jgi:signal transduction histidine kinase
MQHLLIATHKQNLSYLADRFPHDLKIYSEMVPLETGTQKAIDNLTTPNTLLWFKRPDGRVTAQSTPMKMGSGGTSLLSLTQIPATPELQSLGGRYWLICATPVSLKGVALGRVYIAQDITGDREMFLALMGNLGMASLLAIAGMVAFIAWYVRRSLHPLKRISVLTAQVCAEQLGEARISLEQAPSEVKELAQTCDRMLMRLSEAWEHQRQLVSNVSHELRTPLTIVSGYLQSTLRRGSNLTPPQREALEIAAAEADRTIRLLQDLLDLARADSGRIHFQLETLVLQDLLVEVAAMTSQYGEQPMQLECPTEPLAIKADVHRLKQVLLNLVDNAIKYSEPDSPITLRLLKHQEQAKIQVCDRGIGIPLAQQTRIFERFYRLDETRNRTTGGSGLGLSIVKSLVEAMGGSIAVHSQVGEGSTFTVAFPLVSLVGRQGRPPGEARQKAKGKRQNK